MIAVHFVIDGIFQRIAVIFAFTFSNIKTLIFCLNFFNFFLIFKTSKVLLSPGNLQNNRMFDRYLLLNTIVNDFMISKKKAYQVQEKPDFLKKFSPMYIKN